MLRGATRGIAMCETGHNFRLARPSVAANIANTEVRKRAADGKHLALAMLEPANRHGSGCNSERRA